MTDKPSAEAMREAIAVLQKERKHLYSLNTGPRYFGDQDWFPRTAHEVNKIANLEAVATYLMEQAGNE